MTRLHDSIPITLDSTVPLWAVALAVMLVSCHSSQQDRDSGAADLPAINFNHRVHAQYAEGFEVSYHKHYKLLKIMKPFQDRVDTLRYALVPREIAEKVAVENAREIPIPIRSMIATSTTHIALTDMLKANAIVTGMVGAEYVYNRQIRNRLNNGKITSFPMGEFNKEQALALQPDLLMISGGQSSQFDNYRVLMNAGIDVMVNSEWLETHPLGKAEWVKVLAALLNKEAMANTEFNAVARRYEQLKSLVDSLKKKPLVIANLPHEGAWFVPGGNSFTARFLKDSGADYPWYGSDRTGGLRKAFESVYQIGLKADIWLNPGGAENKREISAMDARFRDFKAFQTGEIYNNNQRVRPSGGNDFWESGVVHPEIVLADLIKIFHPRIVPDHTLYYYQKIQ